MTWTQTHERFRLLNEAETELRTGFARRLPWSTEYAEAFGTPERLAQALRHRWRIRFQAQLDPALSPEEYEATFADLFADLAPLMDRIGTPELREELADASA
ncbi:hypothetical protein [Nocardioides albus]|uniref:Uncharacterized protein n=1 Tax=Nocardioides albus TaxID=1841 RepID=A0A7W5A204_9ACTN|nr:hypothetical protein [Nocardioides albus]MBB3087965.1 hypothetical protein [Nocardioides albus]GGU21632.1 hypothetical protein GCM10007979_20320 [Nocardioides albus]